MLVWLAALAATLEPRPFLRSLRRPINALPIALVALAAIGTLWSDAPWSTRLYAISPATKLLFLPFLLYHFERSTRGLWVFIAFLASCTLMTVASWIVAIEPGLSLKAPGDPATYGIFTKNYIDQSQEFVLCTVVLALPIITSLRDGKIRYWGVSNFRGWRIAEAVHVARQLGMPGPAVCQPYYNLLNRQPEVEVLPACLHYGIGAVPYSPIARGVLAAKYAPGVKPEPGSRAGRGDARMMQTEFREESLRAAQTIKAHCEKKGVAPSQFAAAWVLAHRAVSSVIAGPRTFAQWEDYFGALECTIDAADEALVDGLVAPGHPSTPGYNDPQYPLPSRHG